MADFAILTMNLTDFVSFVRMCLHVPMQGLWNKKERTNAEQYVKVSNNVNEACHHDSPDVSSVISEYMKFYHYSACNIIQVREMAQETDQETDLEMAQEADQEMDLAEVI